MADIFDVETGKFLEKKKIGVVVLDEKNEWLKRGDLFVTEDGRELISDFGEPVTKAEDPKAYELWSKGAYKKLKEVV